MIAIESNTRGEAPADVAADEIEIRVLDHNERDALLRVAPGVFDHEIIPRRCEEFLGDPRHHLAVAIVGGEVVGMASGVHYVHPDKDPELWINEVGVAPQCRNRGVGGHLLQALLDLAKSLGCTEAWVLTDRDNQPAMKLYASRGGVEAAKDQVMFTFKLR